MIFGDIFRIAEEVLVQVQVQEEDEENEEDNLLRFVVAL